VWLLGLSVAQAQPAASVWYRSSDGCPDGAAFIARLAGLGNTLRLAKVGDRVDFVVTLASAGESSEGRLERQTQTGIVAMRDYRDARCENVAEALALTLDLALDPRAATSSGPVGQAVKTASPGIEADALRAPASSAAAQASTRWSLGGQALLLTGAAPSPLWGGALFGAVEDSGWLVQQLRATLYGAHARGRRGGRELGVSLLGARVEGCPFLWRSTGIAAGPCAGVDFGALHAAGQDALAASDTGVWGAASVHARIRLTLGAAIAVESQLGANVPSCATRWGPVTAPPSGSVPSRWVSLPRWDSAGKSSDRFARAGTRRRREIGGGMRSSRGARRFRESSGTCP
jgi:hypothetical protein